jgi:hypothetical protein
MPEQDAGTTATPDSQDGNTNSQSQQATPEGAQNTDDGQQRGTDTGNQQIPYPRFKQVNDRLKEAKLRIAELEQANATSNASPPPGTTVAPGATAGSYDLPDPPANLNEKQRVAWYINTLGKQAVEADLGMSLADVKQLLSAVPDASRISAEQQWREACDAYGLDPKDEATLELAIGYVKGNNMDLDTAMSKVKQIVKPEAAPVTKGVSTPQRMENTGVNGNLTAEDFLTWDKKAAVDAAHAGKRSRHLTIEEIIEAKRKAATAT